MVKKYVYGRPFETYAVVNAENVSDAAESEKRGFFREADMKKALEPYGGITWDEPEDWNDAPAMQYRVRMCEVSTSAAGCMRASAAMTLTTLSRSVPCMALITSS